LKHDSCGVLREGVNGVVAEPDASFGEICLSLDDRYLVPHGISPSYPNRPQIGITRDDPATLPRSPDSEYPVTRF
jgi:hypothetical protein